MSEGVAMKVKICGVLYKIIECEDKFDADTHFGQINYKKCEIRINRDLEPQVLEESICHEIVHGMLVHLGYNNMSQDEQFVQALGNAIFQTFDARIEP